MKKPVFILGCSKSGTSLLRNLLDGHPDLFVVPTEAHFFQRTKYWVTYSFRRTKPETLSFDAKKERLIKWIEIVNTTEDTVSDAFTKNRWNLQLAAQIISDSRPKSNRELLDIYMKAMYQALYGQMLPSTKRIVEKSVENAEFATELKRFYPDAVFLHIVRSPYSNLTALRKYTQYAQKTSFFPYLKNSVLAMYNSYYFLYKNREIIDGYKTIRYEDILTKPEDTMKKVAEYLGIPFCQSLLKPTMFSESWHGNSSSKTKFSSISAKNLNRWRTEITALEIWVVNHFFDFVIRDFNYQPETNRGGLYRLQKAELPKTYIQNRMFLKIFSRI